MTNKYIQIDYIEFYFGKADRHFTKSQKREFYNDWPMGKQLVISWDPDWNSRKDQTVFRLSEIAGVPVRKAMIKELQSL